MKLHSLYLNQHTVITCWKNVGWYQHFEKKNRDENTEPAFLNLFGLRPLLTTSAAEDVQTLKGRVTSFLITFFPGLHLRRRGPSINDITHLGRWGSAKRWHYSTKLFSKTGDEGEGGVKNLKKLVRSFMDGHKTKVSLLSECTKHLLLFFSLKNSIRVQSKAIFYQDIQ